MSFSFLQIQLGWQVLLADPYKALDGDNRRIYNPQLVVAGQEDAEFAEQKGHDTSYLKGEPEQEQQGDIGPMSASLLVFRKEQEEGLAWNGERKFILGGWW